MNSTSACGAVAIHTVSQNSQSSRRPKDGTEALQHVCFKFFLADRNFSAGPGL